MHYVNGRRGYSKSGFKWLVSTCVGHQLEVGRRRGLINGAGTPVPPQEVRCSHLVRLGTGAVLTQQLLGQFPLKSRVGDRQGPFQYRLSGGQVLRRILIGSRIFVAFDFDLVLLYMTIRYNHVSGV
jgi:hypothetical protein